MTVKEIAYFAEWKSQRTVYDYYGFCREVCYVIVTNNENVIEGGKNCANR